MSRAAQLAALKQLEAENAERAKEAEKIKNSPKKAGPKSSAQPKQAPKKNEEVEEALIEADAIETGEVVPKLLSLKYLDSENKKLSRRVDNLVDDIGEQFSEFGRNFDSLQEASSQYFEFVKSAMTDFDESLKKLEERVTALEKKPGLVKDFDSLKAEIDSLKARPNGVSEDELKNFAKAYDSLNARVRQIETKMSTTSESGFPADYETIKYRLTVLEQENEKQRLALSEANTKIAELAAKVDALSHFPAAPKRRGLFG